MTVTADTDAIKPNLFILGALQCGTTSLHAYLADHPAIFMSAVKEPTYFLDRATLREMWPEREESGFWRGEEYYLELFKDAAGYPVRGETGTNYTKLPRVPDVSRRIADFSPDARFIYIMRDPIKRTISHYWHDFRRGEEKRDILTAFRQEPHYREVSHYAMQLKPYLDLFGRDRVKALTLEALNADPEAALSGLFEWLGVDPAYVPPSLSTRKHVTPQKLRVARGSGALERFRRSGLWDRVGPKVPRWLRKTGRRLSQREVDREAVSTAQAVEYLRPLQRPEADALAKLLGRNFDEWTTLYGPGS